VSAFAGALTVLFVITSAWNILIYERNLSKHPLRAYCNAIAEIDTQVVLARYVVLTSLPCNCCIRLTTDCKRGSSANSDADTCNADSSSASSASRFTGGAGRDAGTGAAGGDGVRTEGTAADGFDGDGAADTMIGTKMGTGNGGCPVYAAIP
jgi:hypothetical protein